MRFTTAWSGILSQNVTLRFSLLILSISLGFVTILAVKMGFQDPIVIERSCYSKSATKGSVQHTKEEIESFLKITLSQRFDSGVDPSLEYISLDEITFRKQEQQELVAKNMVQKVLVNSIQINGSDVKVDADRVIGVGQIRTALVFPITATISSKSRSESNPYGLVLSRVSQSVKKEDSQ
jgi:hypothetical protein